MYSEELLQALAQVKKDGFVLIYFRKSFFAFLHPTFPTSLPLEKCWVLLWPFCQERLTIAEKFKEPEPLLEGQCAWKGTSR